MKLYIKNMVCNRCIMVVKDELVKIGLHPINVLLGEVTLDKELSTHEKKQVEKTLNAIGFYLIDDKKSKLIEKVKILIIELIHQKNNDLKTNLSTYLSNQLHQDYHYISNLFSEVQGCTIERYYISQKIERVKELLMYDEFNLSEIAYQLNYSSVAHLSNQFKKITGLTPGYFKNLRNYKRTSLDQV